MPLFKLVQCTFLGLWTYLDKSLLQSKFFQHLIFYVHCTLCRIKVAIAMEWEKISHLRPAWVAIWTLWPRWLWLAMSLCSGAIWPRWRSVAFVAQFFHIANLSRLRTSESEPRRQSEHSDLELRWCLCLLRCNDQLKRVWNCRLLWYAAKLARSSTEESSGSYACWYFQALLKNLDWRKVDIGRETRAAHRNEPLLQQYNVTNCSPFQGSSPCRCPAICKGRDMHLGAIKVKVSPNQKWNF